MGRNLRQGKVEVVFGVLKQLAEKCAESEENVVDKENLIGELCWRLKCTRRTMIDYMKTSISHGKFEIKWKPKKQMLKYQKE